MFDQSYCFGWGHKRILKCDAVWSQIFNVLYHQLMLNLYSLFSLCKFWTCYLVTYCPKLTPPDNGELSTMDVVYNTVVTVTCNTGFKMPDDRLHKSLICLDVNGAVWNDTVTHCQRKEEQVVKVIWQKTASPPQTDRWIRSNLCFLRPTRVHNPNSKSIGSAISTQLAA